MRYLIPFFLLFYTTFSLAESPITPEDAPIIVYKVQDNFDDIKANLEMAITDRGMLVTNILHISEMMERTAKDTGLDKKIYGKAESLEFCSIKMSYNMSLAHPANLSICPLTVSLYTKVSEPDTVYLTYRRPVMLGDAASASKALMEMLDGIVQESME